MQEHEPVGVGHSDMFPDLISFYVGTCMRNDGRLLQMSSYIGSGIGRDLVIGCRCLLLAAMRVCTSI